MVNIQACVQNTDQGTGACILGRSVYNISHRAEIRLYRILLRLRRFIRLRNLYRPDARQRCKGIPHLIRRGNCKAIQQQAVCIQNFQAIQGLHFPARLSLGIIHCLLCSQVGGCQRRRDIGVLLQVGN